MKRAFNFAKSVVSKVKDKVDQQKQKEQQKKEKKEEALTALLAGLGQVSKNDKGWLRKNRETLSAMKETLAWSNQPQVLLNLSKTHRKKILSLYKKQGVLIEQAGYSLNECVALVTMKKVDWIKNSHMQGLLIYLNKIFPGSFKTVRSLTLVQRKWLLKIFSEHQSIDSLLKKSECRLDDYLGLRELKDESGESVYVWLKKNEDKVEYFLDQINPNCVTFSLVAFASAPKKFREFLMHSDTDVIKHLSAHAKEKHQGSFDYVFNSEELMTLLTQRPRTESGAYETVEDVELKDVFPLNQEVKAPAPQQQEEAVAPVEQKEEQEETAVPVLQEQLPAVKLGGSSSNNTYFQQQRAEVERRAAEKKHSQPAEVERLAAENMESPFATHEETRDRSFTEDLKETESDPAYDNEGLGGLVVEAMRWGLPKAEEALTDLNVGDPKEIAKNKAERKAGFWIAGSVGSIVLGAGLGAFLAWGVPLICAAAAVAAAFPIVIVFAVVLALAGIVAMAFCAHKVHRTQPGLFVQTSDGKAGLLTQEPHEEVLEYDPNTDLNAPGKLEEYLKHLDGGLEL